MASTWPAKNNYATGDVLTAANMNGVGDDLNDVYNFSGYAAGKNKIINGDFGIWQRGTSFTGASAASGSFTADRWVLNGFDGIGATRTISQQALTAGSITGYDSAYFLRYNQSVAGTGGTYNLFGQRIEDVRTFAGQTVTFSFWAKAAAGATFSAPTFRQNFGSGGSASVDTSGSSFVLTTSWQRFTMSFALPSTSGKTIGTGSMLEFFWNLPVNSTFTFDVWGVQLEAGSTVSIFQTATGTKQGELAACQRYYWRSNNSALGAVVSSSGFAQTTTQFRMGFQLKQTMRTTPSAIEYSSLQIIDGAGGYAVTNITFASQASADYCDLIFTSSGMTQFRSGIVNTTALSGYLGFTAEL